MSCRHIGAMCVVDSFIPVVLHFSQVFGHLQPSVGPWRYSKSRSEQIVSVMGVGSPGSNSGVANGPPVCGGSLM